MKKTVKIVNLEGNEVESISVDVKESPEVGRLFAQYLRVHSFAARMGQAKTKTRGDVSGGGKKPWKQKGTGHARQGSTRSPIWKGGGVAHGPELRDYALKFNKKYMPKVWAYVVLEKLISGENWFVLKDDRHDVKTKQAQIFLDKLNKDKEKILLVSDNQFLRRSFRNISNVSVSGLHDLNPYKVSLVSSLVTDEPSFEDMRRRIGL